MGFLPEVNDIIYETFSTRQTMLFSATIPNGVRSLAEKFMNEPETIQVKTKHVTLDVIRQIAVETTDRRKQATLLYLLKEHPPFLAIIFCRTKIRAKKLQDVLLTNGYDSDELHGDLSQGKREKAMKRFREAKIQILVATDVAARGLDVEGVTHVFNYDIPTDVESYIHRIGRTGRAGGDGVAYTLVAPKDLEFLTMIEKGINQSLEKQVIKGISIPDRNDYDAHKNEKMNKTGDLMKKGNKSDRASDNARKRTSEDRKKGNSSFTPKNRRSTR
jgi:ATP-dependent RNA helicase DeaD